MTAQHKAMRELFKMFLTIGGFAKCSSVSRIPAFGSSDSKDPSRAEQSA